MNAIKKYSLPLAAILLLGTGCAGIHYQSDDPGPWKGDIHSVSEAQVANLRYHELGYPRIEQVLDSYEYTIRLHANRYGFDWRLILAVMNQESRFRMHAVSSRGAYGLMQIMPATGRDISGKLIIDGIKLPENNIAAGVYYLGWVYSIFGPDNGPVYSDDLQTDRIRLALAAYNGGPTRVRDAQKLAEYLNLDPNRWDIIKSLLPMLSGRYSNLHQYVWESGRPSGGYFYGWHETINYVDSVMDYYSHYTYIFEH
jgi:membrane-bound lytic murein transglycosylase F